MPVLSDAEFRARLERDKEIERRKKEIERDKILAEKSSKKVKQQPADDISPRTLRGVTLKGCQMDHEQVSPPAAPASAPANAANYPPSSSSRGSNNNYNNQNQRGRRGGRQMRSPTSESSGGAGDRPKREWDRGKGEYGVEGNCGDEQQYFSSDRRGQYRGRGRGGGGASRRGNLGRGNEHQNNHHLDGEAAPHRPADQRSAGRGDGGGYRRPPGSRLRGAGGGGRGSYRDDQRGGYSRGGSSNRAYNRGGPRNANPPHAQQKQQPSSFSTFKKPPSSSFHESMSETARMIKQLPTGSDLEDEEHEPKRATASYVERVIAGDGDQLEIRIATYVDSICEEALKQVNTICISTSDSFHELSDSTESIISSDPDPDKLTADVEQAEAENESVEQNDEFEDAKEENDVAELGEEEKMESDKVELESPANDEQEEEATQSQENGEIEAIAEGDTCESEEQDEKTTTSTTETADALSIPTPEPGSSKEEQDEKTADSVAEAEAPTPEPDSISPQQQPAEASTSVTEAC